LRRDARKAAHAYVVVDGTLIPIDRVAADKPFYQLAKAIHVRQAREANAG